jgi:hypothetical protein
MQEVDLQNEEEEFKRFFADVNRESASEAT